MFNSEAVSTINRLDATGLRDPSILDLFCNVYITHHSNASFTSFIGQNLLLWGDLPELEGSDDEESLDSFSEEEYLR